MDLPVTIAHKVLQKQTPKVNVYYPFVIGLANRQAEMKINSVIVSTMNNTMVELGFHEPFLQEMIGQFEIKTNERNILSLTLTVYGFTGGAHGNTIVKALSFDVTTGRQYELKDLFKPDSDYVTVLSKIIGQKVKDWDIQLLEPFTKIRPDQDFYFADHSLVIYFQQYEITAYVWGFPYFPIPILDIQNIIQPDGPLEKLLPF
ncbi:hypothetical protein HMPREF1210_02656 [Paenisporosarcina sp. HGH0030]|uniref:DUF3298 and DUF4163 domain-containing protein n=1 Tax=Paenisporosarcina sp. HGH0030 TaxID=1078085 RepID=UPI00034E24D3|nr:DUF3298 and DUF4163 domain-containing protein [Paenisporosarcina sp. HGH0030]EPD50686.1 hypothetical protein HMPREF1210_02656 [Paenisporosarcina sp. HGH0030]